MFEKVADQNLAVDVAGLQTLPVVVTDELAGLMRRGRRGGGRGAGRGAGAGAGGANICLITLTNVLNNLSVLNIFGGSF